MSTTVDQRVVEMQFDNRNFEKNVSTTMSTLDKLKQSLKLDGASKGFEDIGAAADDVDMSGLDRAVETVQAKFSALSVIGVTALANITNSSVNTGKQLIKSLSVDQIKEGWDKFGSKTTSVATLVAQGNDLNVVNEQLDRLNWFTDETSYNFTDMVSNIAKFTASGKGLEESVTAMEGIATWAALSGQNARTASGAMYQLSQAMGSGMMRKEDYKSIQNASMDTMEFRQKCIDAAIALGTLKDNGNGTYKSLVADVKDGDFTISQFADHLTQDAWFTSDVMMKVFNDYSSAVSKIYEVTEEKGLLASQVIDEIHETSEKGNITIDEAIRKLGYVDEAGNLLFDSFGLKAFEAAQKARTWGDAVDSVKDAVSTGWMNTFEIIFGNSEEATELWTDLANAMWDVFASGGEARNELLKGWKELGGRNELLEGFWNMWEGFFGDGDEYLGILGSLKEAFREVFPPMTSERLLELTQGFKNLTEKLKPSEDTLDKVKRAFKGLFSIVDIGKKAITAILKPIGQLFGSDGFASVGDFLLSIAADIGDFFTSLNEGFNTEGIVSSLSKVATGISNFLTSAFDKIGGFSGIFSSAGDVICKVASKIWSAVTKVFGWIRENVSAGDIFAGLAGGGIFVAAKKFSGLVDKIKGIFEGLFNKEKSEGLKSKFSDILDSVNESLQSFTSGIKVVSLIGIAAAIALLSSSFKKISELDAAGIAKSLFAIGVSLAMMMKALNSMPKNSSFVTNFFGMSESTNLVKSGVSMILMAESIKILADAIIKLSELSLKEIAKGLIAVGGGMIALTKGLNAIGGVKIPLRTSIALLALAESCKILGDAFEKFSSFSWDEISRGLVAMGGSLGELVTVMAILEKFGGFSDIFGSLGILITVESLGDLADSLEQFGGMSWGEITKGLTSMGGALGELAIVLGVLSKVSKISVGGSAGGGIVGVFSNKLFGKGGSSISGSASFSSQLSGLSNVFSAGSIWITIQGLSKLADSLKNFGEMHWGEIGRGLTAMGGALLEVGAVTGVLGKIAGFSAILGGASIWITVQSLSDLANAFKKFGEMSWGEIGKGLAAMGGALLEVGAVTGALGVFAGFSGILGGAAIWVTVQGLDDLANALKNIGGMAWDELDRGLIGMGAALAEATLMSGALGTFAGFAGILGGAAIWTTVQGLDDLANALKKFGEMNWGEIGRGLTSMGAALAEIAVGGLLNTLSGLGALSIRSVAEPLGILADSVKKWSDVDIPIGLGARLRYLAMGVQAFTFGGLGAGAIALVAKPLGIMADSVGKWSGVSIPDGLNSKLSSLALGVMAFSFDGLGASALSSVAPAIGTLADSVKKWSGVSVPDNLEENLTSLANGVKAFSWAFLGGWSIDAIDGPLASLAKSVKAWKGVSVPSDLKTGLTSLADGVKEFSWAFLGGWSIGAIDGPLTSLAESVKAWKGVSVPNGIDDGLTSLAKGVEAFSFAFVGGWALSDAVEPLKNLAASMSAWKNVTVPDGIEGQLESLAGGVRSFTLDGLGASAISELADPLGTLADSVKRWEDVSVPDGLPDNLKNLAKGVQKFTLDGFGASAIGDVAKPLGDLADSVSKWESVKLPDDFSKKLSSLADGVGKFTLVGIGANAISTVGAPLGDLAESIKKWDGVKIPDEFGSKLGSLAEGIKAFEVDGTGSSILSEAATGLDVLSDSIRKWQDVKIPDGLSGQLESLSTGVLAFCGEGMSDNALADSAGPLGVMADSIRKWTGVSVPEGLSSQLVSLAEGVKAFSGEELGDNTLVTSAAPLGTLAESIGKWSAVTVPEGLPAQLTSLAEGVKAFSGEELGENYLSSSAGPLGVLADSVGKWSNVTVPEGLSSQLTSLAEGVKAFSTDETGSNLLASSVDPIGTLADSIKKWSGVTVPEGLPAQLTALSEGVKAFTFDGSGDGASALATAAPGIGSMADSIAKWSGVTVPEGLSSQLTSLAEGVKAFTSEGGTNILGEASVGVGSMADSIAKWSGVTIPEGLSAQLSSLAEGVKVFTSEGGTNILGEASTGVGTMADSIAKWSGVAVPEGLPAQLISLSEGVKAFTTYGGSNMLSDSAAGIGSMADSIKKWSGATVPSGMNTQLVNLAEAIKAFEGISSLPSGVAGYEKISSVSSTMSGVNFSSIASGLDSVASSLSNFGSVGSSISGVGESIISNVIAPLQNSLPLISNAGVEIATAFSTGITSGVSVINPASLSLVTASIAAIRSKTSAFVASGAYLASTLAKGIRSRTSTASSAGKTIGSSAVSGARTGYTGMYNAGSYLVDGLTKGIQDNAYKAVQAAKDMADEINKVVPKTFKEQSPSRLFMKFGRYLDEGLAIGINDSKNMPVSSANTMAGNVVRTVKDAFSSASNMFGIDDGLQPTIRPVVDLSDVKAGFNAINGMSISDKNVGVMANIRAISSSMNSRSQNGSNDDIISAINKLGAGLENNRGDTYNFGDFTYDDGSEIADAVGTLIRYAKVGRRV